MMNYPLRLIATFLVVGAAATATARAENLLLNGSFEGGLLYWHNIRPERQRVVRGDAKVGQYAL